MRLTFLLPITLTAFSLLALLPKLFWPQVLEGQIIKQTFVAHMTSSFARGDFQNIFPIRYFFELWHEGPTPWAEEVPLYHVLAAMGSRMLHLDPIEAARILSFCFGGLLLGAMYRIARVYQSERAFSKVFPVFAVAIFANLPAFRLYASSVMPDLPMLACILLGYADALENRRLRSFAWLGIACLFKYYAVFSLASLMCFELQRSEKQIRVRIKIMMLSGLAFFPTFAYLVYFLSLHIPNPITEFQAANGYGHFAGHFIFQLKFYLRFFNWTLNKTPTLWVGISAITGLLLFLRQKKARSPVVALIGWHTLFQLLFALIFASSFFVHDHYAIGFLLPSAFFSLIFLFSLPSTLLQMGWLVVLCVWSFVFVQGASVRQTNYAAAAEDIRSQLSFLPDRSVSQFVFFQSDLYVPTLAVLSEKSGWISSFQSAEQNQDLIAKRLADPRTTAVVYYSSTAYDPTDSKIFEKEMNSGSYPFMKSFERHYSEESPSGRASVLRIYTKLKTQ